MQRRLRYFSLLLSLVCCAASADAANVTVLSSDTAPNIDTALNAVTDSTTTDRFGNARQRQDYLQTEVGASYDYLNNSAFDPWYSAYVEASHPFGYHKTVYGRVRYLNEFNYSDGDIFAGIYYPIITNLTLVGEGSLGFAHKITPLWSLFGQLQYQVVPAFLLWAGLRNSEYEANDGVHNETQLLNASAEYWFSDYRLFYSFYEARGNGGVWNPPGHLLQLGYYFGDGNSISLGASMGHEVERISEAGAPLTLATYDQRSIFLLGRQWLSNDWGVSYELGWHQLNRNITEQRLYDRYGIRLGIRRRFGHTN